MQIACINYSMVMQSPLDGVFFLRRTFVSDLLFTLKPEKCFFLN